MQRTFVLFSLCLLVFPIQAFAASDVCAIEGIAATTGTPLEQVVMTEAEYPPVYATFANDLAVGDRVSFEVLVDGVRHFSEELELIADRLAGEGFDLGATPVVELLSANSARLGVLHRLASSRQIEIAVSHNGVLVNTVPFLTLVAETEGLGEVWPQAVRSTVSGGAGVQPLQRSTCTNYCDVEQDDCYLNRCGQFGSEMCYDACDLEFLNCLSYCGICQPSSSTSTIYTQVEFTYVGPFNCHDSLAFGLGEYANYRKKIKKTVTTTINFDCSQTVTSQVSYFYTYCWQFQYAVPCISFGTITNYC